MSKVYFEGIYEGIHKGTHLTNFGLWACCFFRAEGPFTEELADSEYSGEGGERGVVRGTSVLVVFWIPSWIFSFSLVFCNKSFNAC